MAVYGLGPSEAHHDNGMTLQDMVACTVAADQLDEVIIFRSTGPWSKRWIKKYYPTKNFHVKGKSSDWGPQAGFVPYDGIYSKVGGMGDGKKAKDGTADNDKGLKGKYAAKRQLTLDADELNIQRTERCGGGGGRLAIDNVEQVQGGDNDLWLVCTRPADHKIFRFRAIRSGKLYEIFAYSESMGSNPKRLMFEKGAPLEVMTSCEYGADNRPMTGDYDLMAICPRWGNLNEKTLKTVSKPGLKFVDRSGPVTKTFQMPGQTFNAGSGMDRVLDMRSNTGAKGFMQQQNDGSFSKATFQGMTAKGSGVLAEHADMGNLTPRILRCINTLNNAMIKGNGPLRRVHHNAESHRNYIFGALLASEMGAGDGFPMTVFQPEGLLNNKLVSRYGAVSTLETMAEFKEYAGRLNKAGYFVPRNWTWGMSVRDRADHSYGSRINV